VRWVLSSRGARGPASIGADIPMSPNEWAGAGVTCMVKIQKIKNIYWILVHRDMAQGLETTGGSCPLAGQRRAPVSLVPSEDEDRILV
jgi:hypothetical protein